MGFMAQKYINVDDIVIDRAQTTRRIATQFWFGELWGLFLCTLLPPVDPRLSPLECVSFISKPLHLSQPWCYFSCCGCVYLLVFIERKIFSTALRDSFMDCQINSRNQHKSPRSSISLLAFNFIWIISFRHFRLGMNVLIYVWSQVDLDGWSVYEWPYNQDRSKNVKNWAAARGAGSEGWQPVYRIAI